MSEEISAKPEAELKCNKTCEVYSRVVGYFRPVHRWNAGKQEEYKKRMTFSENKAITNPMKSELQSHITTKN